MAIDFTLTADQLQLRQEARDYARKVLSPTAPTPL